MRPARRPGSCYLPSLATASFTPPPPLRFRRRPGRCTCLARRSVLPPAHLPRWPRLTRSPTRGPHARRLASLPHHSGESAWVWDGCLLVCFARLPCRPGRQRLFDSTSAAAGTSRGAGRSRSGPDQPRFLPGRCWAGLPSGLAVFSGKMALRVKLCRSLAAVPHWAPATSGIQRGIVHARARLDASTTSGPSPRLSQHPYVATFPGTHFAYSEATPPLCRSAPPLRAGARGAACPSPHCAARRRRRRARGARGGDRGGRGWRATQWRMRCVRATRIHMYTRARGP